MRNIENVERIEENSGLEKRRNVCGFSYRYICRLLINI